MTYIDGFVAAVPTANKDDYLKYASRFAPMFREKGALRVVEAWGDDVPHGKLTDFHMAVKAQETETVLFSFIEWPDKATRDAGWAELMKDPAMQPGANPMPFDGKRLIYGGFASILDQGAKA
jgi:uncharacterized protein YbaA (DUF1428 family)